MVDDGSWTYALYERREWYGQCRMKGSKKRTTICMVLTGVLSHKRASIEDLFFRCKCYQAYAMSINIGRGPEISTYATDSVVHGDLLGTVSALITSQQ